MPDSFLAQEADEYGLVTVLKGLAFIQVENPVSYSR